jgi:hypothetical protein
MASKDRNSEGDRGKRAGFDRTTGEVTGSGAGAGGNPDSSEDYDSDLHSGSRGPKGKRRPAP